LTERLYYQDSYLRQFAAKCVRIAETSRGVEVVLDQTAFYPTSGGQPNDLGLIEETAVREVCETEDGEILHLISQSVNTGVVHCSIDWTRRFDHMQQHTGQHILSQAFLRTDGLDTVSFHMGSDYATIDLSVQSVSSDQVRRAENLANEVIRENRLIRIRMVTPEEAPSLGLRKESRREGPLRIVEVEEFDVSACGGTHVRQTGEIGEIVVRKIERVNRQVRVEFVCGQRALDSHRAALLSLDAIGSKLSVGRTEAVERVERMVEETKQMRKLLQEKNKSLAGFVAAEVYAQATEHRGIRLVKHVFRQEDFDFLKQVAQFLISRGPCVALLGAGGVQAQLVLAQSESLQLDLRRLLNECCGLIEGRGGGSATLVQGGGRRLDQLEPALDLAELQVVKMLSQDSVH
jgi:alanyl-tRNA synthetase